MSKISLIDLWIEWLNFNLSPEQRQNEEAIQFFSDIFFTLGKEKIIQWLNFQKRKE